MAAVAASTWLRVGIWVAPCATVVQPEAAASSKVVASTSPVIFFMVILPFSKFAAV